MRRRATTTDPSSSGLEAGDLTDPESPMAAIGGGDDKLDDKNNDIADGNQGAASNSLDNNNGKPMPSSSAWLMTSSGIMRNRVPTPMVIGLLIVLLVVSSATIWMERREQVSRGA